MQITIRLNTIVAIWNGFENIVDISYELSSLTVVVNYHKGK